MIEALQRHDKIGLDTSIFIYYLEDVDPYADLAEPVFDAIADGSFDGVTSMLTLMELTVQPLQAGQPDIADEYETRLLIYPNLSIQELTRQAMRRAAELRARYRLRAPDAIQIAACIDGGATAFLTNDTRLRRVTDLNIIILNDFIV